jgi:hypothetical protein
VSKTYLLVAALLGVFADVTFLRGDPTIASIAAVLAFVSLVSGILENK